MAKDREIQTLILKRGTKKNVMNDKLLKSFRNNELDLSISLKSQGGSDCIEGFSCVENSTVGNRTYQQVTWCHNGKWYTESCEDKAKS